MARALTRTNFHSSKLIRTLVELAVLQTAEPADALGEKLGQWIAFTDAIVLSSVHGANAVGTAEPHTHISSTTGFALDETFSKARTSMEHTITQSVSSTTGRTRAELMLPRFDAPLDDAKGYAPFRRYHQAHQREMESSVRSLRTALRDGVAKASPQLRQLVALDAAFDDILCEREGRLLGTVPSLLEKRFNYARKAHLQAVLDTQQDDSPDAWMKPGAWLARFCNELQAVLLAELDLRLQPAIGLLEAFNNEKKQYA